MLSSFRLRSLTCVALTVSHSVSAWLPDLASHGSGPIATLCIHVKVSQEDDNPCVIVWYIFFICSSGLVMYLLTYHKEVLGPLITRDDFHHLCNHSQSRPWCKSLDLHWRWDTFICVAVIGPELSGAMSGVHGLTSCDIHSHGCFVWLLLVQSHVTQCQSSIHSHGAT